MTAPEPPEPEVTPVITEAWGALWELACTERRDWERFAVKAAMRSAADGRGVPYKTIRDTVLRLAWDLDARTRDVLAELTNLDRSAGTRRGSPPEVITALLAGNYEAARKAMHTSSVVPVTAPAPETETETNGGTHA